MKEHRMETSNYVVILESGSTILKNTIYIRNKHTNGMAQISGKLGDLNELGEVIQNLVDERMTEEREMVNDIKREMVRARNGKPLEE